MEGVTSRQKEDMFQDKAVLKILLLSRKGKPGVNASLTDAVQLHFSAPHWDLKVRTNITVESVCESMRESMLV